jgi:hypothetical protein
MTAGPQPGRRAAAGAEGTRIHHVVDDLGQFLSIFAERGNGTSLENASTLIPSL